MVKEWDPTTWSISEPIEVYVKKNATLNEMGLEIVKHYNSQAIQSDAVQEENIHNVEDISCTKINSAWNFHRVQLPYETWHLLHDNNNFIASAPFYVSTDGLLFIIKKNSKMERVLSEVEKGLYNCAEYENNIFINNGQKRNGVVNKEKGVKITVKR